MEERTSQTPDNHHKPIAGFVAGWIIFLITGIAAALARKEAMSNILSAVSMVFLIIAVHRASKNETTSY